MLVCDDCLPPRISNPVPRCRHTASRLAEQGSTVLIHGRKDSAVRNAVAFVKERSDGKAKVEGFVADISSLRGMNQLCDDVLARTDRLDCLINNAGKRTVFGCGSTRVDVVWNVEARCAVHQPTQLKLISFNSQLGCNKDSVCRVPCAKVCSFIRSSIV